MRLIDADYLSKELRKSTALLKGNTLVPVNLLLSIIEKTPTAYDVDKVVGQLEESHNTQYRQDGSMLSAKINISIDKTIEIVKAGGVNG